MTTALAPAPQRQLTSFATHALAPLIRRLAGKTGRTSSYVGKLAGWRSSSARWQDVFWGRARVPADRAENLATALFLSGQDHADFVMWVQLARSPDVVALELLNLQARAGATLPPELESWRSTAQAKRAA